MRALLDVDTGELEAGTAGVALGDRHLPAVGIDDTGDDSQPEPGPVLARRETRGVRACPRGLTRSSHTAVESAAPTQRSNGGREPLTDARRATVSLCLNTPAEESEVESCRGALPRVHCGGREYKTELNQREFRVSW